MTKQKFHFGIIGCGAIAGVHAQAIAAMEDAHLESVCDSDPDRAKAFAQAQGCRWHTTPEALLADPQIQIVCICVPSGLHADYAVLAAQAGKHIVVEKPMAITRQQLEELLDAIRFDRRPFVDEKEGRKGVEIILAAYDSERTGEKQFLKG